MIFSFVLCLIFFLFLNGFNSFLSCSSVLPFFNIVVIDLTISFWWLFFCLKLINFSVTCVSVIVPPDCMTSLFIWSMFLYSTFFFLNVFQRLFLCACLQQLGNFWIMFLLTFSLKYLCFPLTFAWGNFCCS